MVQPIAQTEHGKLVTKRFHWGKIVGIYRQIYFCSTSLFKRNFKLSKKWTSRLGHFVWISLACLSYANSISALNPKILFYAKSSCAYSISVIFDWTTFRSLYPDITPNASINYELYWTHINCEWWIHLDNTSIVQTTIFMSMSLSIRQQSYIMCILLSFIFRGLPSIDPWSTFNFLLSKTKSENIILLNIWSTLNFLTQGCPRPG